MSCWAEPACPWAEGTFLGSAGTTVLAFLWGGLNPQQWACLQSECKLVSVGKQPEAYRITHLSSDCLEMCCDDARCSFQENHDGLGSCTVPKQAAIRPWPPRVACDLMRVTLRALSWKAGSPLGSRSQRCPTPGHPENLCFGERLNRASPVGQPLGGSMSFVVPEEPLRTLLGGQRPTGFCTAAWARASLTLLSVPSVPCLFQSCPLCPLLHLLQEALDPWSSSVC